MEWKRGKSAVRTGRTHRSRFAQSRGNRSEGLLIHLPDVHSSSKGDQDEKEAVTYSLGKQNRWLLPEVIKASSTGYEDHEGSGVVLVERCSRSKPGKADCVSVFNSKRGTIRKPKRKFAQAKDLLGDGKEFKTHYEVVYPHPSGSRGKSTKRPASHLGKRKKNSCGSSVLEDDYDDMSETEYLDVEEEDDFSGQIIGNSLSLDLQALINSSPKPSSEAYAGHHGNRTSQSTAWKQCKQNGLQGKCVYVEGDKEMEETHLELLAQIKAGWSLLDARDEIKNNQSPKLKVRKRRARNRNDQSANKSRPQGSTCPFKAKPVNPAAVCEGIVITLRRQETMPAALEQQWSNKYKEGTSHPRAFVLNVTPLMSLSNGREVFIVFRVFEDHADYSSGNVKALVSLVVCNDVNNTGNILADFVSQIKLRSTDKKIWTLEDIVNVAICIQEELLSHSHGKVDSKEPRKPRLSLDVFTHLFGWKSKTFSSQAAQQQINELHPAVTRITTAEVDVTSGDKKKMLECEICFLEMDDCDITTSYLSLSACGHWFCNECWRTHLRTQIEHGHTVLRCPGYECSSTVDDVTLMSLVPSLYGRHLSKRLDTFLEMDPEWKWCPADQCKLIVKATTTQVTSEACDAKNNASVQPVPVVCVCGTMWCFKCQEDAHWPATCREAQIFRQRNASYARMVTAKKKRGLITSVQVKHCPSCYYPVEKGLGCNHMTCILCHHEFCWVCLQKFSYSHECRIVPLRKINLLTRVVNEISFEHIAVMSRVARASNLICKIHRKLDKIEQGLDAYEECFPLKPDIKGASHTEKRLILLSENKVANHLKEVFNFKFQAHLVLEGVAIRLSFSNGTTYPKKLAMEFSRLLFIVDRMDEILKDLNRCLVKKECLFKLKRFIKFGKKCILFIGRNTK